MHENVALYAKDWSILLFLSLFNLKKYRNLLIVEYIADD